MDKVAVVAQGALQAALLAMPVITEEAQVAELLVMAVDAARQARSELYGPDALVHSQQLMWGRHELVY